MKTINEVHKTIEQIILHENDSDLVINQPAIEQEVSQQENLSLPIKIVAIVGGFFASLALIAFLFISETESNLLKRLQDGFRRLLPLVILVVLLV